MYKPKVFLSHSKLDNVFIHKLNEELHRCNIETWLDEIDIQHGDSWLKAIFDDGIAQCDFILIYLTENSIRSSMVAKEIDASIISQLRNNKIRLLPYVKEEATRNTLRLDLQAIQSPIFNEENFCSVFPIIVSNIWSHYLNITTSKITIEKENEIQKLKLEVELNKSKNLLFNENEYLFNYIISKYDINTYFKIEYKNKSNNENDTINKQFNINIISTLLLIYNNVNGIISYHIITNLIYKICQDKLSQTLDLNNIVVQKYYCDIDFMSLLQRFGLVVRNFNPETPQNERKLAKYFGHSYELYTKSEKYDQFILWLELKSIQIKEDIIE